MKTTILESFHQENIIVFLNESLKFKSISITYQGYYPLHLPVLSGSSTDLEGDTNRCDDGVQLLRFSPWDLIGECSTLEVFRLSTRD